MEIKAKIEDLRKNKIFVGLPCYGGAMMGMCARSLLDMQGYFQSLGIECRFSFLFNESLITRARNYLSDEFLRARSTKDRSKPAGPDNEEPYTHLLFIDSDINFDPRDVLALIALDRDIIGGPYPKKSIKWWAIKEAIQKHPDIDPGELDKLVGDFVFNAVAGTKNFNVTEPIEVLEIGTGYMLIKREVFERFEVAYPNKRYRPDHAGQKFFDGSRYIHAYFDCEIDRGENTGNTERYLSEDYLFCQKARRIVKNKDAVDAYVVAKAAWDQTPDGLAYGIAVSVYNTDKAAYDEAKKAADTVQMPGLDIPVPVEPVVPTVPESMPAVVLPDNIKIWLCPWMLTHHVGTFAFQGNLPAVANYLGKL